MVSGGNLLPLTPIQDLTHSARLLHNVCGPFALIVHPSITASPSIRVGGVRQNVPAKFGEFTPRTTRVTKSSQGHMQREAKWNLEGTRVQEKIENVLHKFLFEEEKLQRWPRFECTLRASLPLLQTKPDQQGQTYCKMEFELKILRY